MDYYSDNQGDAPMDNSKAAEGGDEHMEGETALLPKSILGGKDFKPGEEVVLKIVRMHDDEVEVAYAPAKPGEGEEHGESSEMDGSMNKLSAMAGGGNS
jgi:hypothetical protein